SVAADHSVGVTRGTTVLQKGDVVRFVRHSALPTSPVAVAPQAGPGYKVVGGHSVLHIDGFSLPNGLPAASGAHAETAFSVPQFQSAPTFGKDSSRFSVPGSLSHSQFRLENFQFSSFSLPGFNFSSGWSL